MIAVCKGTIVCKNAFTELYCRERERLQLYVQGMVNCPAAAEDICHDVFVRLWTLREKETIDIEDVTAFLYRMAHNKAVSYVRREKKYAEILRIVQREGASAVNGTEEAVLARELRVSLQRAIEALPARRRTVYVLARMEGMELKRIAERLSISHNSVKEMMRKANGEVREKCKI